MSQPTERPQGAPPRRFAISKVIDRFNPGITLLVALWIGAFELRTRLMQSGHLAQTGDEALQSLLLVIPIMLAGWALLRVLDRRYRLGLFP